MALVSFLRIEVDCQVSETFTKLFFDGFQTRFKRLLIRSEGFYNQELLLG